MGAIVESNDRRAADHLLKAAGDSSVTSAIPRVTVELACPHCAAILNTPSGATHWTRADLAAVEAARCWKCRRRVEVPLDIRIPEAPPSAGV